MYAEESSNLPDLIIWNEQDRDLPNLVSSYSADIEMFNRNYIKAVITENELDVEKFRINLRKKDQLIDPNRIEREVFCEVMGIMENRSDKDIGLTDDHSINIANGLISNAEITERCLSVRMVQTSEQCKSSIDLGFGLRRSAVGCVELPDKECSRMRDDFKEKNVMPSVKRFTSRSCTSNNGSTMTRLNAREEFLGIGTISDVSSVGQSQDTSFGKSAICVLENVAKSAAGSLQIPHLNSTSSDCSIDGSDTGLTSITHYNSISTQSMSHRIRNSNQPDSSYLHDVMKNRSFKASTSIPAVAMSAQHDHKLPEIPSFTSFVADKEENGANVKSSFIKL